MKILLENELKNLLHIIDKCSIADVNTGLQHLYKELFSKVDIYIQDWNVYSNICIYENNVGLKHLLFQN